MYKPENAPDISVYMMAKDAAGVVSFAKAVFGASEQRTIARPDGSIMHAELRIGDSVIMLAQATKKHPAFPVWLHVYVEDVDATYRRALDHGAPSVQEPLRKDDDDKRGGVSDPSGNIWWIATMQS